MKIILSDAFQLVIFPFIIGAILIGLSSGVYTLLLILSLDWSIVLQFAILALAAWVAGFVFLLVLFSIVDKS